ncbi:MAG: hypothetical protein IKW83_07200 [Muribaculaceae bacterium]|nr:hypothetical protein [Muribaculaceae bacterium]
MFKKLAKKIGRDKIYHFGICFIISLITGVIMLPITNLFGVLFSSFMSGTGAALAKEYGDKCSPTNKWDWKDVIADYIGIGFAILILVVLKWCFWGRM